MNTRSEAFFTVDRLNLRRHVRNRGIRAAAIAMCMAVPLSALAAIGDLDPQFGSDGQVQVVGNLGPHVLELPDGRLLVVGEATPAEAATTEQAHRIAVFRFLSTGSPDISFGDDGRVFIDLFDNDRTLVTAATQQLDGKVVLAGQYWRNGGLPFVARIDANGAPDPAFGSGGTSEPGTGGTEPYYSSVLVREDGEILAAISDWTSDRIDRFGADGRSLGNLIHVEFAPAKVVRQSDGRLIVSGYNRSLQRQGVMRFDVDGNADPTFGDNGFAALDVDYSGNLAIEPSTDRIVLCGPGIVRLTPDGHLDTTFGVQGTGYVALGSDSVPAFSYCQRLLTISDGSLVFIGIRSGEAPLGYDRAFVAGLTSSGLADLRYGAGSGASELELGSIRGSTEWWGDPSSALIKTRDGDALLSWATADGLRLARIELGDNGGPVTPPPSEPPPAVPPPLPEPTPEPAVTPPVSEASSSGGGGAFSGLDLLLLALASTTLALRPRRRHVRGYVGTGVCPPFDPLCPY